MTTLEKLEIGYQGLEEMISLMKKDGEAICKELINNNMAQKSFICLSENPFGNSDLEWTEKGKNKNWRLC